MPKSRQFNTVTSLNLKHNTQKPNVKFRVTFPQFANASLIFTKFVNSLYTVYYSNSANIHQRVSLTGVLGEVSSFFTKYHYYDIIDS